METSVRALFIPWMVGEKNFTTVPQGSKYNWIPKIFPIQEKIVKMPRPINISFDTHLDVKTPEQKIAFVDFLSVGGILKIGREMYGTGRRRKLPWKSGGTMWFRATKWLTTRWEGYHPWSIQCIFVISLLWIKKENAFWSFRRSKEANGPAFLFLQRLYFRGAHRMWICASKGKFLYQYQVKRHGFRAAI